MVFHVINRGVGKNNLFFNDDDYLAFERVICETLEKRPMRILSYCLMRSHWHFVLWPEKDGDLGRFMQRLTVTHVTRFQKNYNMVGFGHVYQGRFKSFPLETNEYFYRVNRYAERNALRANLVKLRRGLALWQFVDSPIWNGRTSGYDIQMASASAKESVTVRK